MGRKRNSKLPFKSLLFKYYSGSWMSSWPSCHQHPRTLSFRLPNKGVDVKNPTVLDEEEADDVEAAMQAMSSNRLLLDERNSRRKKKSALIMDGEISVVEQQVPFEGSVAVEMESADLYNDFRVSMKEMMEAVMSRSNIIDHNGDKVKQLDMVWFEEMLGWYLRMNKRWTHDFIVRAYLDLILEMMMMMRSRSSSSSTNIESTSTSSNSISSGHGGHEVSMVCSCCSCSTCASSSSYISCLSEIEEVAAEDQDVVPS